MKFHEILQQGDCIHDVQDQDVVDSYEQDVVDIKPALSY